MKDTINYILPIYGGIFKDTVGKPSKNLAKSIASKVKYLLDINKISVEMSSIEESPMGVKIWLENDLPYFERTVQTLKKILSDLNLQFEYEVTLGTESNRKGVYLLFIKNKEQRETVDLGELLKTDSFWNLYQDSNTKVALGINDKNEPVILNVEDFPHALISGTTGSGKSTCMNAIATSIIATVAPSKCKLVLIDPKATELEKFRFAPHNLFSGEVATNSYEIKKVLWQIERIRQKRQIIFADNKVANIQQYNNLKNETMSSIIVLVDELGQVCCDKSSQMALFRLASLSRAAGIYLICATQKPSAKLLPTEFRDNLNTRIAFKSASKSASRVAIEEAGAEKLIGKGDGLYYDINSLSYRNFQCVYVSDEEIAKCIEFSNSQFTN